MITEAIDALLPQTQCQECGFPGCMPYAKALTEGKAPIDRCAPGGADTVRALGKLLNIDATPFLASAPKREPSVAKIREEECIGCTKCIDACPVDAIIGSRKRMHTILASECTGCGLCVEPCPVDCIEMHKLPAPSYDKDKARRRYQERRLRLSKQEEEQSAKMINLKINPKNYILQAIQRKSTQKKHDE